MKKLLSLICAGISALCVFGFTACGNGENDGCVNLLSVTPAEVGVRNDVDYYVIAEPAASAKVNAIEALEMCGDLQELYGGENGYPQAVVVAKKDVLGIAERFMTALTDSGEWLKNEGATPEKIVAAVQTHLSEGMTPAFNAKNLTKQVIENCSVDFKADCAVRITEFMGKLNAVSETPFGTPAKEFFFENFNVGAVEYDGDLSVYMPDGAPALGLAGLMSGEVSFNFNGQIDYNVVDASVIQTYVAGASPKAAICVLPVNLAVKLLGGGQNYALLGTLTHGNLYIVSNGSPKITPQNIDVLAGKTVGVVNLSAVPGLTFKVILKNNGLEYSELT